MLISKTAICLLLSERLGLPDWIQAGPKVHHCLHLHLKSLLVVAWSESLAQIVVVVEESALEEDPHLRNEEIRDWK